jgi:hypothetical protein
MDNKTRPLNQLLTFIFHVFFSDIMSASRQSSPELYSLYRVFDNIWKDDKAKEVKSCTHVLVRKQELGSLSALMPEL